MAAQFADGGRAKRSSRHRADHLRAVAQASQCDGDVGLGTTDLHLQPRTLQQQLTPWRAQSQQQFSEADELLAHLRYSPF